MAAKGNDTNTRAKRAKKGGAETPAEPPKPGDNRVGVASCDEYLDKMAKCISRLSAETQAPMKQAMAAVDGRADGRRVSGLVRSSLQG